VVFRQLVFPYIDTFEFFFHFNVIIHGLYYQAVLRYHRNDHAHSVPNGQHGSKYVNGNVCM
jgi:hypothetical protein